MGLLCRILRAVRAQTVILGTPARVRAITVLPMNRFSECQAAIVVIGELLIFVAPRPWGPVLEGLGFVVVSFWNLRSSAVAESGLLPSRKARGPKCNAPELCRPRGGLDVSSPLKTVRPAPCRDTHPPYRSPEFQINL